MCFERLRVQLERLREARGLGDVVAQVTEAVGIKPCARCKHTRRRLNMIVPFALGHFISDKNVVIREQGVIDQMSKMTSGGSAD